MLKQKQIRTVLKAVVGVCVLLLISGAVHSGLAKLIISRAQTGVSLLAKRNILLSYQSITPQFCLFRVCLKAYDVQVRFPNLPLNFCVDDLTVQKGLFGKYKINAAKTKAPASDCVHITGEIAGTPDFWHIQKLLIDQKSFSGEIEGTVDMAGQDMKLEGTTQGLADFVSLFIPADFQFLATLVFSNGKQKISVRTDDSNIRIFDVPVLPKSVIFRK